MKYLIGTIVTFIVLAVTSYFVLQIWDINIISKENFNKSVLTLGILLVLSILLNILFPFFFKNQAAGYDQTAKNVAQRKKDDHQR